MDNSTTTSNFYVDEKGRLYCSQIATTNIYGNEIKVSYVREV